MTRPDPHVLAIDVGTLSARAGVFDTAGRLVAVRSARFELRHPAEHQAVYRMDDIWRAVLAAAREALAAAPEAARGIAGIAVDATSSTYVEASGAAPLDGDADVLCWMDHRAEAEALAIDATRDRYLDYLGGSCSPEMYLPKILWLKRHRPETWARVTAVRDLSDELSRRLSGVDRPSLCGLACKFPYLPAEPDPWRRDLLARLDLAELPRLGALGVPPGRVGSRLGGLAAEPARLLGLSPDVPVAVGLIDAEAGALGVLGLGFSGRMNRTLALIGGTSTNYMAFAPDERLIPGVWGPFRDAIFPGQFMHEAGQSFAGAALDAVLDQHPASPGPASAARHAETARAVLALLDEEGPAFAARRHVVPDFLGNRSPLGDGQVRALLFGVGTEQGRRSFLEHYFAVARGLVLQSRQIKVHFNRHGYAFDRVTLSGGQLRNPLMLRLFADALDAEVVVSDTEEPVLLGTAMVAATAAGLAEDLFAAVDAMAPAQRRLEADPAAARAHDAAYRIYERLFDLRNTLDAEARAMAIAAIEEGVHPPCRS
jgi:FGGY-family pentulose kinase